MFLSKNLTVLFSLFAVATPAIAQQQVEHIQPNFAGMSPYLSEIDAAPSWYGNPHSGQQLVLPAELWLEAANTRAPKLVLLEEIQGNQTCYSMVLLDASREAKRLSESFHRNRPIDTRRRDFGILTSAALNCTNNSGDIAMRMRTVISPRGRFQLLEILSTRGSQQVIATKRGLIASVETYFNFVHHEEWRNRQPARPVPTTMNFYNLLVSSRAYVVPGGMSLQLTPSYERP